MSLVVVWKASLHEPILDECLGLIASGKRRRKAQDWVSRFGRLKKLKHRVARGLCQRGILRETEDKVMLFFTRKLYPEIDPTPERRVVERLRRAISSDSKTVSPETVVLVALVNATGILKAHFDKKDLNGPDTFRCIHCCSSFTAGKVK